MVTKAATGKRMSLRMVTSKKTQKLRSQSGGTQVSAILKTEEAFALSRHLRGISYQPAPQKATSLWSPKRRFGSQSY